MNFIYEQDEGEKHCCQLCNYILHVDEILQKRKKNFTYETSKSSIPLNVWTNDSNNGSS